MNEMPLNLASEGCTEACQTQGARLRGDASAQRAGASRSAQVDSRRGAGSRWARTRGNWGLRRVLSSLSNMMGCLAVQ